jgi:hypothetical protein
VFHEQVRFGDSAIVGQRELEGFVERASAVAVIDWLKNTLSSVRQVPVLRLQ